MESYIGEEQLEVTLKQFIAKEHLEHLRKLGEGALSNISNSIITTKTASGTHIIISYPDAGLGHCPEGQGPDTV